MFLAIDIGNSKIKVGTFENSLLTNIQQYAGINSVINFVASSSIKKVGISSVVPKKTRKLSEGIKNLSVEPIIITKDLKFNLKLNYDSVETLGIDRICSVEGAYFLFNKSKNSNIDNVYLITIDFGTALTLNIAKYPTEFSGGLILPNFNMMFHTLKKNTAQLPETYLIDYKNFIGKNTKQSIASGVLNSIIGVIERTINYIKEELKADEIKIYITGGNAEKVIPHLKFKFELVKGLVLYGIKAIYEKNVR